MIKPVVRHDLETAFGSIYGPEEEAALLQVLKEGAPSCSKRVKRFEQEFAEFCGTRHALAVTNATTGLTLAGIALGIEPGDEVITTPLSWIATASAFSALGAKIVFCDVDPRTLNLDPAHLEALITPRTRAIVPVHLFGQCAPMDEIRTVAEKHGVAVVEDAAHNPGGDYLGRKAGAWGELGVFSFHQQKNMSTLGEGGMLTTDRDDLAERVFSYRSLCARIYGGSDKYLAVDEQAHPMGKAYWKLYFDDIGYNYRMTDAQAAVGSEQLKKLPAHNRRRMQLAAMLTERLQGVPGLTLPYVDPRGTHVFHLYMVQLEEGFPMSKEDFLWELYTEMGIKAWSHYMPIHLTDPYRREGHREGECQVAEAAVQRHVTLPIHPRLDEAAVDYLAASIRALAGG